MEQDEFDDIFLYLKENKYVDGKNDSEKRILRRKAKNFLLGSHDNLYYTKDSRKKQVVTKERLKSVLRLCHVDCGSHLGRDKTYHKVKERYFWNTITKDVGDYLKCCEECQRNNKKTKTSVSEMTPVPVPERVWEKIGIDLIGPFLNSKKKPLSANGYRLYIKNGLKLSLYIQNPQLKLEASYIVQFAEHPTIIQPNSHHFTSYISRPIAVLPNETLDNYVENVGDGAVEKKSENIISNLELFVKGFGEKLKQNVDKAQKAEEAYDRRHNVDTKS
ncbi:unnamed protein product [Mytilus edulis]|uniref:Integrase zinc-binding domain-containing protein n=1 Tax=Mytilus edulis TaxID=6550 RepID=A0A8S3RNT3_MYTED|nr:unnamed protein product [Mytilus edulis]